MVEDSILPESLEEWIDLYHQYNKDIKILFLMKYKRICIDHHWLYIEMSRWFNNKNKKEISVFLLQEALRNEVKDSSVIKNELLNYKNINPCSPSEASRYLNPVGFEVLGRVWNEMKIETFYDKKIFFNTNISFEEYRLLHFTKNDTNIIQYKINTTYISSSNNDTYGNNKTYISISNNITTIYKRLCYEYNLFNKRVCYKNHQLKALPFYSRPVDFLVDLKSALELSPDIIRLYFINKTVNLVLTNRININDFYITDMLEVKALRTISSVSDKCALYKLFPDDYCIEDLIYDIKRILKYSNIKRYLYKYQIYLYELK